MKIKKIDEKINKLTETLSSNQLRERNKYDSLAENKREIENGFEEKIKTL
jgi:hypothetical protein